MPTWLIQICSLYIIYCVPNSQHTGKKLCITCLNPGKAQGSYPTFQVAVKSHFLLRYAAFSQIPYRILVDLGSQDPEDMCEFT